MLSNPKHTRPLKSGGTEFQFVLDNFAINSDELTDVHKDRLDRLAFRINRAIRMSPAEVWLIHLIGSASQSGDDDYNEKLSKRRAEGVQKYLEKMLVGARAPRTFRVVALGESAPEDKRIFENYRDRAVGVVAKLKGVIPPKPPVIDIEDLLKPRPPELKKFKLRVDAFAIEAFGAVLTKSRIAMNFSVDGDKKTSRYHFIGQGGGGGVPGPFPATYVASTSCGKPQEFRANPRFTASDFSGLGILTLADRFLFGGPERPTPEKWRNFPRGTVGDFELPPSATFPLPLPGKSVYEGIVSKGYLSDLEVHCA